MRDRHILVGQQKGPSTSQLYTQLDPFALKLTSAHYKILIILELFDTIVA